MSSLLSLTSAAFLLAAASGAPAAAPASPGSVAASAAKASLPWIADDYPAALAEAKRRGVPLFVEAWAPW